MRRLIAVFTLCLAVPLCGAILLILTSCEAESSALSELRCRGATVYFEDDQHLNCVRHILLLRGRTPRAIAFGPKNLFSGYGDTSVVLRRSWQVHDDVVPFILRLDTIKMLDLGNTRVSDSAVRDLAAMKHLSSLWLNGTPITDRSVESLASMKHLRLLDISQTRISPDGRGRIVMALRGTHVKCSD